MYLRVVLVIFLSSVVFSWFLILTIVFSLNSSEKSSNIVNTESSVSYVNSTNWDFGSFIINNSIKCNINNEKETKLLVLVHSSVTHFDFRQLIRKYNRIDDSITIFLLGFLDDPGLQRQIDEESKHFGDIVQGSFHDSYSNLTLKHIMGLTWTAKFCSSAQLVMKMDDDIFIDYKTLNRMLALRYPEPKSDWLVSRTGHKMIACYIQHKMKVIRNTTSRWFVADNLFSNQFYPDFCSGWAYITTVDVIYDLLDQIPNNAIFWIDDVYITGILRQSLPDIELESLNKFFNVDVTYLYHWVTDTSLHKFEWRYIFSNANGDLNLLTSALSANHISEDRVCCYPSTNSLINKQNSIDLKPKNIKGVVRRISI